MITRNSHAKYLSSVCFRRSSAKEEPKQALPVQDYLFSPIKEGNTSCQVTTPDQKTEKQKTEKQKTLLEATSILDSNSRSLFPPTSSPSQFSAISPLSDPNNPDGNDDLKKLSAKSRERYLKNMKILDEDSSFDADDSLSAAHVSYFCDDDKENEQNITFQPDEDYYKNAVSNDDVPTEKKREHALEAEKEPMEYHTITSIVQPTMEEMLNGVDMTNGNGLQDTDAIPCLDDSLVM